MASSKFHGFTLPKNGSIGARDGISRLVHCVVYPCARALSRAAGKAAWLLAAPILSFLPQSLMMRNATFLPSESPTERSLCTLAPAQMRLFLCSSAFEVTLATSRGKMNFSISREAAATTASSEG